MFTFLSQSLSMENSSQDIIQDEESAVIPTISGFPCHPDTEESVSEDVIDFTDSFNDMTLCEEFFGDDDTMLDNMEDDVIEEDDLCWFLVIK